MFEKHLKVQEGLEFVEGELVATVAKSDSGFTVATQSGKTYETKFIFLATGSRHRKLNVPGEHELDGKGVAYCSTCDAPLFNGKDVAVVGGGNAGLEAVVDLLPYAKKVYLLEYNEALKGDAITQEKIKANPNVEICTMAQTTKIIGDAFVSGLEYLDRRTNETHSLSVQGVFVEIGAVPNADMVRGLVETNAIGELVVNHKTQETSCPGIWAAGDVTDVLYKQNNISAGDAVKAVLNIHERLVRG